MNDFDHKKIHITKQNQPLEPTHMKDLVLDFRVDTGKERYKAVGDAVEEVALGDLLLVVLHQNK